MFIAERFFEKDSFNIALNGSGSYPGFLEIIDEYGFTKSANLAHYYAGMCYKNIGKNEEAIEYLKKFDSNDKMIAPIALGAIGDCYANLGEVGEAVKFYKRAAKKEKNDFTSPLYYMRAAILLEQNNEFKNALDILETIKNNYYNTEEGRNIEKYITRVKIKGNLK
jgi:tetratricopeptide (TPR) repeat protein